MGHSRPECNKKSSDAITVLVTMFTESLCPWVCLLKDLSIVLEAIFFNTEGQKIEVLPDFLCMNII